MRTNPQEIADLFTFTKEILIGKLSFFLRALGSVSRSVVTLLLSIPYSSRFAIPLF